MACKCEACERLRYYKEVGVPSDVIEHIIDVEMDRDYYKAILDGSFPKAREILQKLIDRIDSNTEEQK